MYTERRVVEKRMRNEKSEQFRFEKEQQTNQQKTISMI